MATMKRGRPFSVIGSLAFLLLSLLVLVLTIHPVHGQRAAVSAGTKLQQDSPASGSSQRQKKKNRVEGKQETKKRRFPLAIGRRHKHDHDELDDLFSSRVQDPIWVAITRLEVTALTVAVLMIFLIWHVLHLQQKAWQKTLPPKNNNKAKGLSSSSFQMEDDDFAVDHDGHVVTKKGLESIDLAFSNVRLEMATKKKKNTDGKPRLLLDGSIHGRAKPGRMLAVMGPSGAGKSVFVHALAGRLKDTSKLSLTGRRYINGHAVQGDSLLPAAFVEQDVNFFPHMTVRETLEFRVSLKLGSLISTVERDTIVTNLMAQLGLTKSADTIVGDTKVRGLSGGERKRLSIAVEMISSPSLLFLDEPTSGLDSAAAASLVDKLRQLANQGKTVVAVIHQPSQQVFSMFDDLLLLSDGRQMYFGPVADARYYMERQGYPAEKEVGTAEYVLECISRFPRLSETDEDAQKRISTLAESSAAQKVDLGLSGSASSASGDARHFQSAVVTRYGPRASIFKQFSLLMKRALKEAFRGKGVMILKTVQQVTVGLIYGGIYKLGNNQASIQDRYGLISLTAIGAANMAIAAAIRAFPKEKAIVANEIASKMYRTLPYFIGKALSELPLVAFYNGIMMMILYNMTGLNSAPGKLRQFMSVIMMHGLAAESLGLAIGAISANSDVALGLFPAVLILNIIFDGRNISVENTPKYLRWISKVGLIRWGFEGLSLVEFGGLTFSTGGPRRGPVAKTGEEALERMGLGDRVLSDVFKAQATITAACWGLSFLGMTLTRQKFLVMKAPKP
ncbi:Putative white-brown complex homolog protein 30 [Seminavis robusta]|uniref:White-brown complex homolog protein 30 n=1 Tax=Seminavis robusta TaxID=568900 RepID=A0A9N8H1F9_9STRA|nr:Putative white-brown complex homolog protein 30 [Seminavis robusta]|eukprot:Sro16_g011820.1 Putative white-brown complex homolog protein 30 (790) ;mRNA; r:130644-133361